MNFRQIKGSVLGTEQMAKAAYAERAYNDQCQAGIVGQPARPADPASARQQLTAIHLMVEHLAGQRCQLRDLADFILGEQPPQPQNAACGSIPSSGGITAEVVQAFAHAGEIMRDIDAQIERLQRVSS